jgi:hypothetical protein
MSKTVIIADSAVDLSSDLRQQFGVADYVHGIVVRPDGSQFLADDDWGNMTPGRLFRLDGARQMPLQERHLLRRRSR